MARGVMVAAPSADAGRVSIVYIDDGGADDLLAYLEGRCGSNGKANVAIVFAWWFDVMSV
jgi:hypothetical protein